MKNVAVIAFGGLVGLAVFMFITSGMRGDHPLREQPAPLFTANLLGGESVSLADHRGSEVVMLDFWASWCGPCRVALPYVAELAAEFADRPVKVYAVNVGEDPETVARFVEQEGLDLTVVLDTMGEVAGLYDVTGIPQMVIIGKDGVVADAHTGFHRSDIARWRQVIEGLLTETS